MMIMNQSPHDECTHQSQLFHIKTEKAMKAIRIASTDRTSKNLIMSVVPVIDEAYSSATQRHDDPR